MSRRTNLQDRYELKNELGHGGMGVVYHAWDTVMRRDVALKTILDVSNPALLELFYKEWGVLSTMVHPNLIGIYDIGEFEHEGARKPFFVMPMLPGVTLDKLIKEGSPRLTVPKIVDLIVQASRGIHAAHEKDLVHRDIKPSNIFVMDDDSVKIIDFGIAREASTASKTSLKGTLFYLSPEQLLMKPPTPLSDQYALAVVAYEALTRRRPFAGTTDAEVVEAILKSSPPPASELNSQVPYAVSQVVHKALAKQPFHRFFNAREFGDALQKSLRNEPLEYFDSSKIKPRLERARTSFESGDYAFAQELLAELEGEGHLDQDISMLRSQIDHAVRKTSIRAALESSRRFVEAQEFPLALRKIQEALELDPQDPDALALKSQVERERRERKIDEWMQLARQHQANASFRQAREALDNVLQLKPNETAALQLLHEVDRKEQDIAKTREEKSKLYQMAQHAWERGEVTSALSKLEVLVNLDKDVPESDTGRSTTYQNFFNQVRSEHDNIKNSYDEARRHLAADNFEAALAMCRQFLAKYPNHALFQSLKFDIEERQRQRISSLIAETDQRAQAEPDLDKRMALLEEVARQHPGESHFERALRTVKDKRDLVNSITGKARYFEERGQFNEALDQWQILRSIHGEYPGLGFEIQRLQKRRDQQAREDAQSNWVKEIDRHLEMGDYERAARSLESAQKEFPADAELAELARLVQKSQDSAAQAAALLGKAREKIEAGSGHEALQVLREATGLDSKSAVIRKVLINTLIDEAQRTMEENPESAEPLVAEILALEPAHAAALALDAQIADRKRDEFLSWCMSQARRLQSDGDFDGALAVVAQGRGQYPNETRLQQLQSTLQKGKAEQSLSRNRESTKPTPATAVPPAPAKEKTPAPAPAASGLDAAPPTQPGLAAPSGGEDFPFTQIFGPAPTPPGAAGATPKTKTPAPETARPAPPPAGQPEAKPAAPLAQRPPDPKQPHGAHPTGKQPPADAKRGGPKGPPPKQAPIPAATSGAGAPPTIDMKPAAVHARPLPPPKPGKSAAWLLTRIGIPLLLFFGVAATGAYFAYRHFFGVKEEAKQELPGQTQTVTLTASQTGARIFIDGEPCGAGECRVPLTLGQHRVEARLPGYRTAMRDLEVTASGVEPISLELEALPPFVQLGADTAEGKVTLNGKQLGAMQGTMDLNDLQPGENQLDFVSGAFRATLRFEASPAVAPRLLGPVKTAGLKSVVITGVGSTAYLYSTVDAAQVSVDGAPIGTVSPEGLELKLNPGPHEIVVSPAQGNPYKISYEASPAPVLLARLFSDSNLGGLRIATGEDSVSVFIDGQKYRRETQRGRLLIYLAPKRYTIKVEKEGFTSEPAEASVEVKRGEEARADFRMAAAPQKAVLSLRNALPGAEVLLDNKPIGTVRPDGTFSAGSLEPGRHTVAVRRERYKPFQTTVEFAPGRTVELDAPMESSGGTLKIEVTPADARITIKHENEAERPVSESTLQLPEGSYTVSASARGYASGSQSIRVQGGRTATVTLALAREGQQQKKGGPASAFTLSDWTAAGGWEARDKVFVRRGGDYFLAPVRPRPGTYTFTVVLLRGRRIHWVVDYRDQRNHVFYQVDDDDLERIDVVNGRKTTVSKSPHKSNKKLYLSFLVTVTANSISTSILRAGTWVPLENGPRADAGAGQFGFFIPGRDEIAVSDFKFQPN